MADELTIERTYPASAPELWDLWTTKEGFESWWGPDGFRTEVKAIEARLGGMLHYDMIADTPEMIEAMRAMGRPASHETSGRFSGFEPHRHLELTQIVDFVPGVKPYDFVMRVEFFPAGNSTRMVITLTRMHDDEMTRMSRMGFTSQLGKLDRRYGVSA